MDELSFKAASCGEFGLQTTGFLTLLARVLMAKKLLMGNEAFAHAALESGVGVVAGYPGTPSSEVIETVAARVADGSARGVHVEWSTNEKAALEVVAGASYAGARTLFTCKQVGLNVADVPLMSLNYVGVKGGCVLFVADDPGPISSQTEQDTRRFASFAKAPVFDPADVEQGFAMMKAAFDLSERYSTPVIVRPTTRVCHSSTFLEVQNHTDARPADGFVKDDSKWVIFPARAYRGHLEIQERLACIEEEFSGNSSSCSSEHEDLSLFNPVIECGDAPRFGIVCGGVSTAYALEALEFLSQRAALPSYRFMQIGTPFPFPDKAASAFLEGLERVIVFEELDSRDRRRACAPCGLARHARAFSHARMRSSQRRCSRCGRKLRRRHFRAPRTLLYPRRARGGRA